VRYNPEKHHRRSIRLKGYDYSMPGAYFITICTNNRECLFGEIIDGEMKLNDAGRMIERWYFELANKFLDIQCDEFVIMPNHFHCIIIIVETDINVGADLSVCPIDKRQSHRIAPTPTSSSIPRVVQWFKTMTTNEYIRNVKQNNWIPFIRRLWQRNYYEHIIRNDKSLDKIRQYIINNPLKWEMDFENINNVKEYKDPNEYYKKIL